MGAMKIRLTRRRAITILIAVCGGATVAWWERAGSGLPELELSLPSPGILGTASFEVFMALSRIVLLRDDLDRQMAQRLFKLIMDEPWAPKHIHNAYATLRAAIIKRNKAADRENPASLNVLGAGEKWFVSHLVTTWYLGIYYHEQQPTRRVAYSEALMFDAIRGVVPIPYLESTGFGAWADAPPLRKPKS
jgi:hypothetical protein